jgi:hypothetical protein
MKGVSLQEVLSGFPGIRLPSRWQLYWLGDYLCSFHPIYFSSKWS